MKKYKVYYKDTKTGVYKKIVIYSDNILKDIELLKYEVVEVERVNG